LKERKNTENDDSKLDFTDLILEKSKEFSGNYDL
jgi:hypothetical protein